MYSAVGVVSADMVVLTTRPSGVAFLRLVCVCEGFIYRGGTISDG